MTWEAWEYSDPAMILDRIRARRRAEAQAIQKALPRKQRRRAMQLRRAKGGR